MRAENEPTKEPLNTNTTLQDCKSRGTRAGGSPCWAFTKPPLDREEAANGVGGSHAATSGARDALSAARHGRGLAAGGRTEPSRVHGGAAAAAAAGRLCASASVGVTCEAGNLITAVSKGEPGWCSAAPLSPSPSPTSLPPTPLHFLPVRCA